jgi:hypothetical protein
LPASSARYHAAFAIAEMRLAELSENVRDRHAGGAFDLVVGVGEPHSQPLRKAAADRRLARPHQPDEHDRPVADRRRGWLVVEGLFGFRDMVRAAIPTQAARDNGFARYANGGHGILRARKSSGWSMRWPIVIEVDVTQDGRKRDAMRKN